MNDDIKQALIPPHEVVSRNVNVDDLGRLQQDSPLMQALCLADTGYYRNGGLAVAHSQITKDDPLRFFVTRDGVVIINPKIIRQNKVGVFVHEGCLSIPTKPHGFIQRPHKITVEYQSLTEDGNALTEVFTKELKGIQAQIFCHEIDHFDGKYVNWDSE